MLILWVPEEGILCLPSTGKPGGKVEEDTPGSSQDLDLVVAGTYTLIPKQCLRRWQRNVVKVVPGQGSFRFAGRVLKAEQGKRAAE